MSDMELAQLHKRIKHLESELERYRRSEQFLEASEANLQLFARCLAHDLNNIVAAILGHAQLMEVTAEPGSDGAASAAVIGKAAERAAEMIAQLLHFTRGGLGKSVPVDLHETIREVADLLRRTIDPDIVLTLRLEAAQPVVTGDPGQIHQMLFNLALNARDAMPDGGELVFSTLQLDANSTIVVSVKDSGKGISRAIQDQIFQPFFTTKSAPGGTGMGLAIVKRVVENHNGTVQVRSAEGEGAEFRITFPMREPGKVNRLKAMAATVH
jgi:signal transduction histidine kinase